MASEARRIAERFEAQDHHRLCAWKDGRKCDCFKASYEVHILARALIAAEDELERLRAGWLAREALLNVELQNIHEKLQTLQPQEREG